MDQLVKVKPMFNVNRNLYYLSYLKCLVPTEETQTRVARQLEGHADRYWLTDEHDSIFDEADLWLCILGHVIEWSKEP